MQKIKNFFKKDQYNYPEVLDKGRLYEKVEDYNAHLERLVLERTLEIKKLQEDQKQAMIDISHNLQTPLAVINDEIGLLSDLPIHAEKIKNVKRSIHQVSQFIRQLLHLAKLDHSAFRIEFSVVDLSSLLNEQIEYFEVMAGEKNVRIISSIKKKILIMGNKRLLQELLTNLISNAIKYRRKNLSESTITIALSVNQDEASLVVTDNGIGIAKEELPDIFTRFYRGSRKQNASGTGLGLAICKKIVEKHSGTISAESVVGKQTSFRVVVPLNK